MKKKILLIVLGVALAAIIINAFRGHSVEYGTKAKVKVPQSEKASTPSVKDVTFIIDNSGSMRGYVDFSGNKAEFQKASKALLATTGDFMSNCSNNLSAKTKALCNGHEYDTNGTITSLSNYSAFSGPVTQVVDLIKKGAAIAGGDSTVCVIVSDMVLSLGKNVLIAKHDKYYNLHSLEELRTKVRDELKDLKSKGKDVMIVKYEGDFNGKFYYNYTENLEPCNFKDSLMTKRPFYYTVIGTPQALKSLCNAKCIPAGYTEIFTSLTLADSDFRAETYQVSQPSGQVQWILGNPNPKKDANHIYSVTMMKDLKGTTSQFTFSFPKFELPVYVSDKITVDPMDKHLSSISPLNDNSSFTVTTCPFDRLKEEQTVNVEFTSPRYVEFASSSTDNDVNCAIKDLEHKTWGLGAVVAALYDAYDIKEGDRNQVLSLQFRILTK